MAIDKQAWQMPAKSPRPSFNLRAANKLVGKHILVGYTYLKPDGSVDHRKQRHGTVTQVDSRRGITIKEAGTSEVFALPPDLRSTWRAAKGVCRLRSTGEEVIDPDVISNWLVDAGATQPEITGKRSIRKNSGYYSVYGIGTRLYGHANKLPDGSYVSTKWITLFFIPLYPLASFRIRNRTPATITFGFGLSGAHLAEPVVLNIRQVVFTYLLAIPLLITSIILVARMLVQ